MNDKPEQCCECYEIAKALGFETVEQMENHGQRLKEHGTPEFQAWLGALKNPQPEQ